MRALLMLLALAAVGYALILAAFFIGQRAFIYFPVASRDPAAPAITLARDGVDVRVSVHRHAGPGAVLYFGGNAEDVSRALPGLREAFPAHAVYALHYRGYGGSGGTPSEPALVGDGIALADFVRARHAQVVVIGRSLGSGVAVQVAEARTPARLVLITPFDSLAAVAARHYPWLPTRLLLHDRYDSAARAARLGTPMTIIAAADDAIVPPAHAEALARAFAPGRTTLVRLEGVGHDDIDAHPRYRDALRGAPGG